MHGTTLKDVTAGGGRTSSSIIGEVDGSLGSPGDCVRPTSAAET